MEEATCKERACSFGEAQTPAPVPPVSLAFAKINEAPKIVHSKFELI
jgi:hypothetical protein